MGPTRSDSASAEKAESDATPTAKVIVSPTRVQFVTCGRQGHVGGILLPSQFDSPFPGATRVSRTPRRGHGRTVRNLSVDVSGAEAGRWSGGAGRAVGCRAGRTVRTTRPPDLPALSTLSGPGSRAALHRPGRARHGPTAQRLLYYSTGTGINLGLHPRRASPSSLLPTGSYRPVPAPAPTGTGIQVTGLPLPAPSTRAGRPRDAYASTPQTRPKRTSAALLACGRRSLLSTEDATPW